MSWDYIQSLNIKYTAGKESINVLTEADKGASERLASCSNRKESLTVCVCMYACMYVCVYVWSE